MPRATISPVPEPSARVAGFQHAMARRLGLVIVPAAIIVTAWLVLPHAESADERGMLFLLAAAAGIAGLLVDGRLIAGATHSPSSSAWCR